MVRLGDIVEQIRGVSYKPDDISDILDDNSVILLRANNIQDGKIVLDDVVYVSKKKVNEKQYLKQGDILVCTSSGSKDLVGKAAYIDEDLPMVFGAFCKVIRPSVECSEYIGHFFQSPYYRNYISSVSAGANINNLRNEHISELNIQIPSLEEQRKIAAVLDKVTDLIAKRRQQLENLDLLVKVRFVEIFGDPVDNPKQWEMQSLSNVCKDIYGGGTPSKSHPEYFEGSIPWVSPKDMKSNIITDSIDHITEEAVKNSSAKIVPKDAVLMVIRSGILKHIIVERQSTFRSRLLGAYFQREKEYGAEHDFRSFTIDGFQKDMEMKKTAAEQYDFLLKNQGDIWVGYEELFEGPTMELEIKNGLFDMEKLLKLSITVCKKYGKETKVIYGSE